MQAISLGFSPCPNDTFIFHSLVHGLIEMDLVFEQPLLEDVETLNEWAMQGRLDVTKLSYHALGYLLDDYCVLASGSALGRGCGPLLVAKTDIKMKGSSDIRVAVPGKYTTAALLFQMFAPESQNIVVMPFDQIMDSIDSGHVDAGVIIHESRFTYKDKGLLCLQDLGEWWEEKSGKPIPLGCIAAKRSLGREKIVKIETAIRHSLERAFSDPQESLPYIQQYSQEMNSRVVKDHISLYVNDFSLELGEEGMDAVESFLLLGREAGILPLTDKSLSY